nr:hypothetical protein [Tanacetum cinerariifolium]
MDNSKRGYIPMQERLDLNKTQGASISGEVKRMQNVPYASTVGSIINPEAELRVGCYCNAGFETDIDDMKSQTEYVFILNKRHSRLEKFQVKYYFALLIANEPGVQKGARHYYRRCHYVHECIEPSKINLLKVHTDDYLADPFTKALPKGKLTQHARSM